MSCGRSVRLATIRRFLEVCGERVGGARSRVDGTLERGEGEGVGVIRGAVLRRWGMLAGVGVVWWAWRGGLQLPQF